MFTTILTVLVLSTSAQVPAQGTNVSYNRGVSIEFTESTQKKADASCARVLKSLRTSNKDGLCEVKSVSVAAK